MHKVFFLFFLLLGFTTDAQNSNLGGLLFNSQNVANESRTSLNLTSGEKISFGRKLTLEFEISFERINYYGYILRVNSSNLSAELLYLQFQNKDTSYLQLVLNKKAFEKKIGFPKNILTRNNWFNVKLVFDRSNSHCILSVNNHAPVESKLNFKSAKEADLIFGAISLDSNPNGEVPNMRIRNVKLFGEKDNLLHFWKLNEIAGSKAKDSVSNLDASASNPNWMINNRYKFRSLTRVGPFPKSSVEEGVPVIYEPNKNRIVFVSKDFGYNFYTNSRFTEKEIYKTPLKHQDNVAVFDNKNKQLYAYYRGRGNVSVYNENLKSWSKVDTSGEHDGNYYFHNSFINPLNGDLCIIGGYGWYTFKNTLQKYDFTSKEWIQIKTKGDFLIPRLAAAICNKNEKGDFFIFGGLGNQSGKQEEATLALNDLYLLSMKDTTIKRIGEIKNAPTNFIAFPQMYYDSLANQLYLMGNTKYGSKNVYKRIYRYDLKTNAFEPVSDSLHCSENITLPLIYDNVNRELFAFERVEKNADSFYVYIGSVIYPPITEQEFVKLQKSESSLNVFTARNNLILVLFIFVSGGGIYFYNRKKKTKSNLPATQSSKKQFQQEAANVNSIYLFGDFHVTDRAGKNITREFTPKLKQLFLLLLMKSYNGMIRGISTEALTTYLWPELGTDQAKNNRNVSFNKLRSILSKLDGVEISNEKNIWGVSFSEKIYCDYKEFRSIIGSEYLLIDKIDMLKEILSRGELLGGTNFEWFDGQKARLVEETISKLKQISFNCEINSQSKLCVADSILFLDSVSEGGLSLKVRALIEIGERNLAKKTYDLFKKEYFRLYAEEFPKSFAEISN